MSSRMPDDIAVQIEDALADWVKAESEGLLPWKRGRKLYEALRASSTLAAQPDCPIAGSIK